MLSSSTPRAADIMVGQPPFGALFSAGDLSLFNLVIVRQEQRTSRYYLAVGPHFAYPTAL